MRIIDPFGLIGSTISFSSEHYYAPGTLLFIALVVLAHLLVLLTLIGLGVATARYVREGRTTAAPTTPAGTLSTIPRQRIESPTDQLI
jgi:hypothetical protein